MLNMTNWINVSNILCGTWLKKVTGSACNMNKYTDAMQCTAKTELLNPAKLEYSFDVSKSFKKQRSVGRNILLIILNIHNPLLSFGCRWIIHNTTANSLPTGIVWLNFPFKLDLVKCCFSFSDYLECVHGFNTEEQLEWRRITLSLFHLIYPF